MTPNGTAEYSPATPTSGEVTHPIKNGSTPKRADALPAICPCDSIANVKEGGLISPSDEIYKKSGITNANKGPCIRTTNRTIVLVMQDNDNPAKEYDALSIYQPVF